MDYAAQPGTAKPVASAMHMLALNHVNFAIRAGESIAVMGPSGSGKTTLLNCVATIDTVTSGHILVDGRDITGLRSRALAKFRRDDLGFIFQDSNLLDTLTAYENIALALTIQKAPVREIDPRVREAARTLGIEDVLQKYPYQMSGGQKQRVAAARATVTRPHLVLADEPTGALDSRTGVEIMELFKSLHAEGQTVILITHNQELADEAQRVVRIADGLIQEMERGSHAV
mgnify:CR=1 FL=1